MRQHRSALIASAAIYAAAAASPALAQLRTFNVPAQPALSGIPEFARQADVQILVSESATRGRSTSAVQGQMSVEEGLRRLLDGTGLNVTSSDGRTFTLAQGAQPGEVEAAGAAAASEGVDEQAIVVTGTNIRGAGSSASPLTTITRDDIDLMGAGTAAELIRLVPQNFNGGASDLTLAQVSGGGDANNAVGATGVNLRGLGNSATLILVNGRRLAPGNYLGNFIDISSVPITTIARVDILPDGGSAIYGSDAIGGVVNLILRRNERGAETRLRFSTVTDGDSHEVQLGQTLGLAWHGGSALLAYEYLDRTPLESGDRDFTKDATRPTDLIPEQERHSVVGSLVQSVGTWELFADALYSNRFSSYDFSTQFFSQRSPSRSEVLNATVGARGDLSDDVNIEASGSYALGNVHYRLLNLLAGGTPQFDIDVDTAIATGEIKIDGTLFEYSAGPVQFAAGTQYRHEVFESFRPLSQSSFHADRNLIAGFAEVRIPFISLDGRDGPLFELTLADRLENYSDFGWTNNPKVGLVANLTDDVRLRGTWGTSFRAPNLNDLDPNPTLLLEFPNFDPTTGGITNALFVFGGNPGLNPEEAETWSAGIDVTRSGTGFAGSLNYFDVSFTNQIIVPGNSISFVNALRNEAILGPTIIQRNPSQAQLQQLIASGPFIDVTGSGIGTVGALADYRSQNLSSTHTNGLDFSASYEWLLSGYRLQLGVDGVYIFSFKKRFSPSSPAADLLDTPYNPVDLRLRGRAVLIHGGLTSAFFVNFVDSYTNRNLSAPVPVDSWLTMDATFTYQFERPTGLLHGTEISFGVLNIFDRDPPTVANSVGDYAAFNYDAANANPLGRYVYLQLRQRW